GSPALRWALVEAAQHTPTGGGPLRQSYERIAKRRGKQVAKVAIARKILTLCFYGLRDGEIRCLAPRVRARTDENTGGRRRAPPPPPHKPPPPPPPPVNRGHSSELVSCQWPLLAHNATDGRHLD